MVITTIHPSEIVVKYQLNAIQRGPTLYVTNYQRVITINHHENHGSITIHHHFPLVFQGSSNGTNGTEVTNGTRPGQSVDHGHESPMFDEHSTSDQRKA